MRYHLMKPLLIFSIVIILCYITFHPDRHAKYYEYIPDNNILSQIITNYLQPPSSNLKSCDYEDLIKESLEIYDINKLLSNDLKFIKEGGEYTPKNCIPKYSTAVIVSYRNRPQQLEIFLKYMHSFLSMQRIHYRIYISEQNSTDGFNRAMMLNYGSLVAMKHNFTCLILHDVDLLPLNVANIYACTNAPRHMSCSIDSMRFNLPYYEIVGGVLAIQASQYKLINGMSNKYFGWGGEDDDLYRRLAAKDLLPIRFSPAISKYTMLLHKHEPPSATRYEVLANSLERQFTDGLSTLSDKYEVKNMPLYTHVIVN